MSILTWVIAGAGTAYVLALAWFIRRNRHDLVQAEADCGIRELEDHLRQQAEAP